MHVRFHAVYVKSPRNITVRAKTKCSWDLWHINLTNTQKNYKVLHTRACTSRRITLGCFTSHSRKREFLARTLNTFFWCRNLRRHWNLRRKPGLHTLEDGRVAIDLRFYDEVLVNRLVSSEWIPLVGNSDDNLSDVVETITKEGLVPLHLWSWCISHEIGLHPNGLVWVSNVFQKTIFSCSSVLFTSLTTSVWHSMCSADGLHFCTFFETLPRTRW